MSLSEKFLLKGAVQFVIAVTITDYNTVQLQNADLLSIVKNFHSASVIMLKALINSCC